MNKGGAIPDLDLSVSRQVTTVCPVCDVTYERETWDIIDLRVRSELVEWLRSDGHRSGICPHAHTFSRMDDPMLLVSISEPFYFYTRRDESFDRLEYAELRRLIATLPTSIQPGSKEIGNSITVVATYGEFIPRCVQKDGTVDFSKSITLSGKLIVSVDRKRNIIIDDLQSGFTVEKSDSSLQNPVQLSVPTESKEEVKTRFLYNLSTLQVFPGQIRNDLLYYVRATLRFAQSNDIEKESPVVKNAFTAWKQFEESQNEDILSVVIEILAAVLDTPLQDGDRIFFYARFICALEIKFLQSMDARALDFIIEEILVGLEEISRQNEARSALQHALSDQYITRYFLSGSVYDLVHAITNFKDVVASSPKTYIYRSYYLSKLASLYLQSYASSSKQEDLNNAISYYDEAIELTRDADPAKGPLLFNYGDSLSKKHSFSKDSNYLDQAIAAFQRSLDHISVENHNLCAMALNRLSGHLHKRFLLSQDRLDIEASITYREKASAYIADDDDDEVVRQRFFTLAGLYFERFKITGVLGDIDAAIGAIQETVESSKDKFDLPYYLLHLGLYWQEKYLLTSNKSDIDLQIKALEQALESIRKSNILCKDNQILEYLERVINTRIVRFIAFSTWDDIDLAIPMAEEAVEYMSDSNWEKPSRLKDLWFLFFMRYQHNKDPSDLNRAIAVLEDAIPLAQQRMLEGVEEEVDLMATELSRLLVHSINYTGDFSNFVNALERSKAIRVRTDATRAGRYPSHLGLSKRDLYDNILVRIREIHSKLRSSAQNGTEENNIYPDKNNLQNELSLLESGDPIFSGETLSYSDVVSLSKQIDGAIVYFQPLEESEDGLVMVIVHADSPQNKPLPDDVIRIAEWYRLKVRDILFGLKDDAAHTAKCGKSSNSDMLNQGGWFASYDRAKKDSFSDRPSMEGWFDTISSTLEQLGIDLMKPLAERLKLLGITRVVLILGDRLGLLPLHAAPINEQNTPFCEIFETCCAPSATILARCVDRVQSNPSSAHFVGIANPDGSLVFSDLQMRTIAGLYKESSDIAHGLQAKRDWLVRHACKGDILSLSTHASFVMERPEQSYFILTQSEGSTSTSIINKGNPTEVLDGSNKMMLDDIWRGELKLKPGAIVVADACETALISTTEMAEEHIGFAAAFLGSGAKTVIASLWAVNDFSTALLMEELYRRLKNGVEASQALQQAGIVLRQLTRKKVVSRLKTELNKLDEQRTELAEEARTDSGAIDSYKALVRASNEFHTTLLRIQGGSEKPFDHPFYWAPFVVYGL